MDAFETSLKAAFAEAPEPSANDGFTARVIGAVATHERFATFARWAQTAGLTVAALAVASGFLSLVMLYGPQIQAGLGMEFVRAQGALGQAAAVDWNALAVGMTQTLMVLGALTGGALAYRNSRN